MTDPMPNDQLVADARMREALASYFEFGIGDTVKVKGSAPGEITIVGPGLWPGSSQQATNMSGCTALIIERMLQQCHGGLQRLYKVMWVRANGETMSGNAFDPEVMFEPASTWAESVRHANLNASAAAAAEERNVAASRARPPRNRGAAPVDGNPRIVPLSTGDAQAGDPPDVDPTATPQ